jgi:hypothetical protein
MTAERGIALAYIMILRRPRAGSCEALFEAITDA